MAEEITHRFDLSIIPAIRRLVVRKRVKVSSLWLMFWGLLNFYFWGLMIMGPVDMPVEGVLSKSWEINVALFFGVVMLGIGLYTFICCPKGGVRIEGYMLLGMASFNIVYLVAGLLTMETSGSAANFLSGVAWAIVIQVVLGLRALSVAKTLDGWSQ